MSYRLGDVEREVELRDLEEHAAVVDVDRVAAAADVPGRFRVWGNAARGGEKREADE